MRPLLLFFLLACGLRAAGQSSPLPIDSATHRVTYRGTVSMPGATADALMGRATGYAATAMAPSAQGSSVSGVWEQPIAGKGIKPGLRVRYSLKVTVREGGYQYAFSDLENKASDVHYTAAPGVLATAPGGAAPIERVLANPDGYRNGRPTAALLAYRSEVNRVMLQAVADLRARMTP